MSCKVCQTLTFLSPTLLQIFDVIGPAGNSSLPVGLRSRCRHLQCYNYSNNNNVQAFQLIILAMPGTYCSVLSEFHWHLVTWYAVYHSSAGVSAYAVLALDEASRHMHLSAEGMGKLYDSSKAWQAGRQLGLQLYSI